VLPALVSGWMLIRSGSSLGSWLLSYGSTTRNEVEYDPPAYVPPAISADPLPETPADDGKLTVAVMVPPGWMGPSDCGNEVPVLPPSVADSNLMYCAVPVPLFFKLMTAW